MAEFDHVIPLPKEAFIVARHAVSVSEVRLLCCGATAAGSTPAGPLSLPMHERTVSHAFERLASLFPTECQSHPDDDVPSGSGDCRLLIVVGLVCAGTGGWLDPPPPPPTQGRWMSPAHEAACGLAALPNSEQAYTIQPIGQHELHVAALSGPGLYYAVQTLSQLLRPALAGGTTRGMVELPLPSVVDWPDTEERGVWNGVCDEDWVEWMSAMKLNFANQGSTPAVFQRGVRVTQTMEPEMMHAAALRGFRYVPQIVHLNFLDGWGLFRAYPELAGIGDSALAGRYFAHKTGDQHRCPDAGNPLLVQILAEWMEEIAQHFVPGGTQDISCWLTERPAEDGRTSTAQGGGQFVLEARAFVAAWQQAREKYPQLIIRLFLSTTAPQRDDVILAEAPPEVKVVRCCFTDTERSAHQPRDLFTDACLDAEALSGRWLGTYDVPLTCNGRVETPMFKLPHRSAHRIQDFVVQMVKRRYSSIAGMLGWAFAADQMCGFNIGALAEWSWNSRGRTPEQFARAWALRSGLGDTDTADNFVKWQSLMGPIEWDVYDSDFPTSYNCPLYVDGPTPPPGVPGLEMYIKQQLTPQLGVGPFRYFSTPSSFDEKLAACEEAAALVGKETILGEMDPTLGREVEVIASYVDLLGSIYVVLEQRARDSAEQALRPESLASLRCMVEAMRRAGARNIAAIQSWRSCFGSVDGVSSVEYRLSSPKLSVSVNLNRAGGRLAPSWRPDQQERTRTAAQRGRGQQPDTKMPGSELGWHVRVHDAIAATARTVTEIGDFARDSMGVEPGPGYDGDMVEAVLRQSSGPLARL